MKSDACQRYLEDPDTHEAHLAECEDCRALFRPGSVEVKSTPVDLDALPLAPWEGASHRSWPLVLTLALLIIAAAVAIFLAAGHSPVGGMRAALGSVLPSLDLLRLVPQLVGSAAQHAPTGWQIGIGIAFLVVNTVLYLLLRRSPKGIDA